MSGGSDGAVEAVEAIKRMAHVVLSLSARLDLFQKTVRVLLFKLA